MWIHNKWQSVRNISHNDFLLRYPLLFVNITDSISAMLHNVAKGRVLVRLSLQSGKSWTTQALANDNFMFLGALI